METIDNKWFYATNTVMFYA